MAGAESCVPCGARERSQRPGPGLRRLVLRVFLVAAALSLGGWAVHVQPGSARVAFGAKAMWGPVTQFPVYHDLGVSIYEADASWSSIAVRRPRHATDPKDPAYRWPRELDVAIAQARRYHMRVALQIIGAPALGQRRASINWAPSEAQDLPSSPPRPRAAIGASTCG